MPFFGIVTEVIPVFSRKPIFGYLTLIGATIAIAGPSIMVWAHPCSPPAVYCCRRGVAQVADPA
nr:cbb3-type cytochrome c oxidase subunit I [Streptomyces sp. RTd22]